MKRALILVGLILAIALLMPTALVWAQTAPTTTTDPNAAVDTGAQALTLTQNLYCGIKAAFASPTAMFIGLAMAIAGLWKMIQGNVGGGLVFIICGALLGAIPSLAESFLNGVGSAIAPLRGTTATSSPAITLPNC